MLPSLPPRTLTGILYNASIRFPDKEALVYENQRITYATLWNESEKLAKQLMFLGVNHCDRIGILLRNSPSFILALYGVYLAGAIAVPIDHDVVPSNLLSQWSSTQVITVLTELSFLERIRPILSNIKTLRSIGLWASHEAELEEINLDVRWYLWPEITETQALPLPKVDSNNVAQILHTSGTTGSAKGVVLTHEQIYIAAMNVVDIASINYKDRELITLPLVRMFGQLHIYSYTIAFGTLVIAPNATDLLGLLKQIVEQKATSFPHVPTVFLRLMNTFAQELSHAFKKVRYVMMCSMSISAENLFALQRLIPNTEIFNTYGLTEAPRSTYISVTKFPEKAASVGKPISGGKVFIVKETDELCDTDEIGEIVLDVPHRFSNYWNDPELTAKSESPFGFRTGDLGYLDKDGYLYCIGRIKDQVNVGGRKFHPADVESVLSTLPGVKEVAIIAHPDNQSNLGEIPYAFVVPNEGILLTKRQVQHFLLGRVESFKIPRQVIFVDKLPRLPSGKLLRDELREAIQQSAKIMIKKILNE